MRLTDLIETFKGHDKVIFKLTGIGEIEYSTVEFKDAIDTIEALQQENEQLNAQAARMREACILGYSYLSLIFHRADIKNWNEVGMCSVKDIKHVLNELESAYKGGNTPATYHNPADVEALRKAREAIQRAKENFEPYGEYEYDVRYDLEEVLAEIDKVMGGKEDA